MIRKLDNVEVGLDPGIKPMVDCLRNAGVETFESCEGGEGHAFPYPIIRFHGPQEEGFRAYAIAAGSGFRVSALRRVWDVNDKEPTGPWWEITFSPAG